MEIPPPGEADRRRLLELYQGEVEFSPATLDDVAKRSDARTASFFKELVRRSVLYAAEDDAEPGDEHLLRAFQALQSDQEALTRNLFGGFQDPTPEYLDGP